MPLPRPDPTWSSRHSDSPHRPARSRSALYLWVRTLYNSASLTPTGTIGIVLLGTVAAAALLAPFIARVDPTAQEISQALLPPRWLSHTGIGVLGTDPLGRDLFSRLVFGSQVSLTVGFSAVLLGGTLGVTAGLVAGFAGGWTDAALMRLVDIQLAFPTILLAIAVIAVLGTSLVNLILVLGVTSWVSYARIVRGEVLSTRERDYVQAAKAIGASNARVIIRHLLPNVAGSIIVIATLEIARMIILEASLSFLGLGIQPPRPSWGGMLSSALEYLGQAWWPAVFPGLAITVTVLSINLVGDWLRSVLDPTLKRHRPRRSRRVP